MLKIKKINPIFGLVIINVIPFLLDYLFGDKDGKIERFNISEWIFIFSLFTFFSIYLFKVYLKKHIHKKQWLLIINSIFFISIFSLIEILFLIKENVMVKNISPRHIENSYFFEDQRLDEQFINYDNIDLFIPQDQKGEKISIKNNFRSTSFQPSFSKKNIYVFGGSTIFSLGVSDSATICSFLQKKLNDNGYEIKVTNVGVIAATLKQQIQRLKLFFEIDKTDIVIFYDGVNDMTKAFQKNKNNKMQKTHIINFQAIFQKFRNFALGRYLMERSTKSTKSNVKNFVIESEEYCKLLIETNRFIKNQGALFYHFLEPNLYAKSPLNKYEKEDLVPFLRFYAPDMELILKKSAPIFSACSKNLTFSTNLNLAFNEIENSPFLDFVHLNESGNKIIADRIYEKLLIDKVFE